MMTAAVDLTPTMSLQEGDQNSTFSMTNDTLSPDDYSALHVYHSPVVIACSFAIGIIGMLSNGFALIVIASSRKMKRRISNMLIANQSLADFASSVTLIAYSTVQDTTVPDDLWGHVVCEVWLSGGLFWGFLLVSTWNLMILTLERFASIVYPVWHNNTVTKKKMMLVVFFIWALPLGQCLLEAGLTTTIVEGRCNPYSVWVSQAARMLYAIFLLIGYNILPLVCFVCCYTKMALVIRKKAQRVLTSTTSESVAIVPMAQTPESGNIPENGPLTNSVAAKNECFTNPARADMPNNPWSKAKRNILITLAWVCALYVICWTPQGVYFFITNLTNTVDFVSDFNNFVTLMIYLNCCVNPFVYLAKYDQFRASARALFFVRPESPVHKDVIARQNGSDGTS